MAGKPKDLRGQQFGYLTVLERTGTDNRHYALWKCRCVCGHETIVPSYRLCAGGARSCGCRGKCLKPKKEPRPFHHQSSSRLYSVWRGVISRCTYSSNQNYRYYGGRGITVCEEWKHSFVAFRDWAIANGYAEGLTLDRVNPNGNYTPDNCRWVTNKEQQNNKRNSLHLTLGGQTRLLEEWAEKLSIPHNTLRGRLRRGWSVEKTLTTPIDESKRHKTK